MIRAFALVSLVLAACTRGTVSTVDGPIPAPPSGTVNLPSPVVSVPESRGPTRTTTSTVPWASVRLGNEKPVAPALPVRIEILALDVDAPIRALGVVSETGHMEVPASAKEVGWYRFGPVPGRPGSAVLAAHVDVAGEGPGIFFNLDRLRTGDQVSVGFEDGTSLPFVVSHAERVPKGDLNFDSVFSPVGEPLLRLITCGGDFDRSLRSYDDNLVVTAHPLRP